MFVLILIPLIYTEALDPRFPAISLVAPPPPQPPPPINVVKNVDVRVRPSNKLVTPTFIPKRISTGTQGAPIIYSSIDIGLPGATVNILNDVFGSAAAPPSRPVPPQRVRIGGAFEAGARINSVTPEYPKIAQVAHISGTVVLHAVIGKDGIIEQLEYVSGPPTLVKSAMDAVKQWRYRPYLLNGEPVEVETTINVDFNFQTVSVCGTSMTRSASTRCVSEISFIRWRCRPHWSRAAFLRATLSEVPRREFCEESTKLRTKTAISSAAVSNAKCPPSTTCTSAFGTSPADTCFQLRRGSRPETRTDPILRAGAVAARASKPAISDTRQRLCE